MSKETLRDLIIGKNLYYDEYDYVFDNDDLI